MAGNRAPDQIIRVGECIAKIWHRDQKKPPLIQFYKVYKDGNGENQTTTSFRDNELPVLGILIKRAEEYLLANNQTSWLGY